MSAIIILLIVVWIVIFLFKILEYVVEKDTLCLSDCYKYKEDLKNITIKCPNCGDVYTLLSEKEMANGGNDLVSCYKCGHKYKQKENILSVKEQGGSNDNTEYN